MIDKEILKASQILREGGIIAYPTDTIWGIGCDATRAEAVQRIYDLKRRQDSKSMLVLVSSLDMLRSYVSRMPDRALEILQKAERPTTVIYPGAKNLAPNLIAEDGSVGIRITGEAFSQGLVASLGSPLVSTSANLSGEASPSFYAEISRAILDKVDHVVNWRRDETEAASASTILKIERGGKIITLRP
jgi:L-threonylcarbamoyladenylate synthase